MDGKNNLRTNWTTMIDGRTYRLKNGWYSAYVYNKKTRLGMKWLAKTKEEAQEWIKTIRQNPHILGGK